MCDGVGASIFLKIVMLQIGKYKFGFAPVSMAIVFVVLSVCAVIVAVRQARPEWSMPLSHIILINETLALIVTLIYGIVMHFALAIADRFRTK